jgi:hypothetical protein
MRSFIEPIIVIPNDWKRWYILLRIIFYIGTIAAISSFVFSILFPTFSFSFDFENAGSTKNTLNDPRKSVDNSQNINGKINQGDALLTDAALIGDFSKIRVDATLEEKSALPSSLKLSIQRSYRSFMLPTGPEKNDFWSDPVYRTDETYYLLKDGTLYPFISENAYLSRYPSGFAQPAPSGLTETYPISEVPLGFRIGSLVAFADGAFIVVSDTEIRPIGSADILLTFGYRFEDVIPANEEEISIYNRGSIFLYSSTHPDGTVYFDQDSGTYYIVDQGLKRLITNADYIAFIKSKQAPIAVSNKATDERPHCSMKPTAFFTKSSHSFSCSLSIDELNNNAGNNYEFTLSSDEAPVDIKNISTSFDTATTRQNVITVLSKLKNRLLSRFGLNRS